MLRPLLVLVLLAAPAHAAGPPVEASVASPTSPPHAAAWNGARIRWRSHADGLAEAARTGRPVMMVIQASWCPGCKAYRQRVFYDSQVVKLSEDFVMVLVDRDAKPELSKAFDLDGEYMGAAPLVRSLHEPQPGFV